MTHDEFCASVLNVALAPYRQSTRAIVWCVLIGLAVDIAIFWWLLSLTAEM